MFRNKFVAHCTLPIHIQTTDTNEVEIVDEDDETLVQLTDLQNKMDILLSRVEKNKKKRSENNSSIVADVAM